MTQDDIAKALELFGLTHPVTRQELEHKRQELLATWYPPRFANLTNNPRRYMEMYKKAEVQTEEIRKAYKVVMAWMESYEKPNP